MYLKYIKFSDFNLRSTSSSTNTITKNSFQGGSKKAEYESLQMETRSARLRRRRNRMIDSVVKRSQYFPPKLVLVQGRRECSEEWLFQSLLAKHEKKKRLVNSLIIHQSKLTSTRKQLRSSNPGVRWLWMEQHMSSCSANLCNCQTKAVHKHVLHPC